jgi:hypothetical protein
MITCMLRRSRLCIYCFLFFFPTQVHPKMEAPIPFKMVVTFCYGPGRGPYPTSTDQLSAMRFVLRLQLQPQ